MAEPQQPPFKVIIIGAGLSGSLLANGLLHASVPVTVYERDEENAKREGYQIHLGESTLVGMRACLSAAQIASVVQKFGRVGGRKGQASVIRHKDFGLLLDLKAFPDYSKSAPINRKVLRDTLAAPLARAGVVKYEKRFVRYEIFADGGRERVRVHFQSGESDECDVLIGADGSGSKVRALGLVNRDTMLIRTQVNRQLGLNNISEINTHVNLLVKQDLPTKKLLALGREFTSGPILSMADNRNFYFSAYVPENSDKSGFDEVSSCSVGAALPIETAPPNIDELSPKEKWDFVSRSITGWAPQLGQGGNQAMRDAAVALPLLIDLAEKAKTGDLNDKHVEDACQAFEDEMIPRTFEWVKKSGGREIIPFNSSKLGTRILFAIASKLVWVARLWYFVKHTFGFSKSSNLDDAPELRE
ncbi:hypothetical protein SLS57_006656 [Botryosphaeria dothidea]